MANFYFSPVPVIFAIIFLLSFSHAEEGMGAGSRALARGGAMIADTSAFFAAYQNPGMLAFKRGASFALHGERHSSGRHRGSLGAEGGAGNKMGIGAAALLKREDIFVVDADSRDTIDRYHEIYMLGYTSLGYRVSKKDGLGISLSVAYEQMQSPLSLDLGWFRFWSGKWQSGLQIRNLGLGDSRPEVFEAGATHRNLFLGKPVSASLMLLGRKALSSRFGFEMEAVKNGDLRLGIDGKNPSAGLGYAFNAGGKTLFADYAIIYEWEAGELNPLSLSLRMKF